MLLCLYAYISWFDLLSSTIYREMPTSIRILFSSCVPETTPTPFFACTLPWAATLLELQPSACDPWYTCFHVLCLSSLISSHILLFIRPQMYRELIQSLYTFDWNMEDRVVVAFINLLGQVVSSNPIFLIPSLQMLVKNFLPTQAMVVEFSGIVRRWLPLYKICMYLIVVTLCKSQP
jgi:hypothetical protein